MKSFGASKAASRLGVSVKALRLYESRGLLAPERTAAGWRRYDPQDMARAETIVAFRRLGLGLSQIERIMAGEFTDIDAAMAGHEQSLCDRARAIAAALNEIRRHRTEIAGGKAPDLTALPTAKPTGRELAVAFDLPWPWGGERFELHRIRPLSFITGPLGSGKTRLARCLAQTLPHARFLGLDRLVGAGGTRPDAFPMLMTAMETDPAEILVVDMIEQGLDRADQEALIAWLRLGNAGKRAIFLMTRSSSILDLAMVGRNETIIYCPPNHGVPVCVEPIPGSAGYESVQLCLAAPEVRARTAGVVARRQ